MGASLLVSALKGDHSQKAEALIAALMSKRVAYEMADLLLPNSELEAQAIKADLAVTTPYHVVPNSVDHVAFTFDPTADQSHRDHVLYAGRFEPHKNQLALIEAMRNSSIPVVLVGPTHPDHLAYYERCKSRLSDNIKIVPGVPHDQLGPLYRAAKVHALPSGFETTGLVSLEAALCGCNIVTTDRGYARDYFKDMAYYCAPNDPESIRKAVTAAFEAPYSDDLRQHILKHFIWEETAKATLEAYVKLVSCRRGDDVSTAPASSAR
jgi:glycosyltransferase involved in cell wall biosynthesis